LSSAHLTSAAEVGYVNLKIEETTTANKSFLDAKMVATNIGSIRIRGIVLSHVSARFAFLFAMKQFSYVIMKNGNNIDNESNICR
jgi:hypothetical protein